MAGSIIWQMYCFTLLLIIKGVAYSHAAGCTQFVDNSSNNETYIPINDATDDDRPLGFLKSTVVYQSSEENPCYTVTGETGQYVELKFETLPKMMLCAREQETQEVFCDDERHSSCRRFGGTTLSYEFFCEISRGCSEADVNFWFRITKGPPPAEDTEEMWCLGLPNRYPESLRPTPPGFTPPPRPQEPIGGATTQVISLHLSLMAVLLSLFLSV